MYIYNMRYEWDPKKNEWLKKERSISFEQVIYHLSQGDVWKISDHPNQIKYPDQKIYFDIINNYIYLVPFIREKHQIFLKTIIPSRKATQEYKKTIEDHNEIR